MVCVCTDLEFGDAGSVIDKTVKVTERIFSA